MLREAEIQALVEELANTPPEDLLEALATAVSAFREYTDASEAYAALAAREAQRQALVIQALGAVVPTRSLPHLL